MDSGFVHLHLHSEYSLLDGACRISEIPQKAKEMGQTAVAITDHGSMYGVLEFYKECKKVGIKPIIGCEIYVAPGSRFDKNKENDDYSHLVLLCKNETGYKNLIKIVSAAYTEGFYSKPRADMELLKEYSNGLVALSACLGGFIPKNIVKGDITAAKQHALKLNEIFGEGNFYLELQDHSIAEQRIVNDTLLNFSKTLSIPLVATNDVHYINKEDAEIQDILMCIQMNKTLDEKKSFAFETKEFYMKSTEQMQSLFEYAPEALSNTEKIAQMCNFDFDFDKIILPAFYPPDKLSSREYLEKLCFDGLYKRLDTLCKNGEKYDEKEYKDRLEYELSVVGEMGYAEYYLIVNDFISYAKSKGIPVGPGRGSGAGSLAAYCLGITDVNPIKYGLLFERFLNPERVSMPDFDIDFCYERRPEVIEYVGEKYGHDHVAQIVTFGTMAARAAIKDVGRVLSIGYSEVDAVAKCIPEQIGVTIDKALSENGSLKDIYENDVTLRHMIDVAKRLEGMPRHTSVHAAGVVITDKPVSEYVPLSASKGSVVTQYTMNDIADLGLLKIDFLGLRYLTVISDAEKLVQKKEPDFSINDVNLNDKAVYKLLSSGKTEGLFQLESGGMKNLLMKLAPENIEDVTAAISLYRPGPMDSIPKYLENRKNPQNIKYLCDGLEEILSVTNGCIVYQEQVMQIFRKLAGYSYGRADIVRRAMSKKKLDVMAKEREYFLYGKKRDDGSEECPGAVANGVNELSAIKLYDEMSEFAKYAFNKSHAACYAFLAYRTAYLKAHYPAEYICSLLTSVIGTNTKTSKVASYINEAKSMGINILPPDINKSTDVFSLEDGNIRFGLLAVKRVGRNFINAVVKERENGPFTSFADFLTRMPQGEVNVAVLESLIKCGAFDSFGISRSKLSAIYESALDNVSRRNRANISGQYDMFSVLEDNGGMSSLNIDYPDIPEFDYMEKLSMEKEYVGVYVSGHPLERFSETAKNMKAITSADITDSANPQSGEVPSLKEKQLVTVLGVVAAKKVSVTKNGAKMAFVRLEDEYGDIEVILFPKVYETLNVLCEQGKVIAATGELSFKDTDVKDENDRTVREGKILVRKIVPVHENGRSPISAFEKAKITVNTQNNGASSEKFTVSFSNLSPKSDLPKEEKVQTPKNKYQLNDADGKRLCLYLKIENDKCEKFDRVKNLLEIFFGGKVPVFIHFSDTSKTVKLTGGEVALNDEMMDLLSEVLGEDAVKTAYRKL